MTKLDLVNCILDTNVDLEDVFAFSAALFHGIEWKDDGDLTEDDEDQKLFRKFFEFFTKLGADFDYLDLKKFNSVKLCLKKSEE